MRFGGIVRLPAIVIGAGLLFASPASAADGVPGLEFSAPASVKLERATPATTTKPVTVWLRNTSSQTVDPSLTAQLEGGDGKAVAGVVVAPESGTKFARLPGNAVARYRIVVRNVDRSKKLSGQLVASSAAASVAPAAVAAELPKKKPDYGHKSDWILGLAALVAAVVIGACWGTLDKKKLSWKLSPADLSFSTGVAASLTAVGAVLGTIVAAGVLSDDTKHLQKESYAALNVTFLALIALAVLAFTAFQKQLKGVKGPELHGYLGGLLLASFLTAWAVFGELMTLYYLADDIDATKGFTSLGKTGIQVFAGVAALLGGGYLVVRIRQIVNPPKENAPGGASPAVIVVPARPPGQAGEAGDGAPPVEVVLAPVETAVRRFRAPL